jgi:hypothetical protein
MSDTHQKYGCPNCKKDYTRKSSLDKHKVLCDFKCKTQRERNVIVEEAGDIPDHVELVKIVQELMLRNINLEEKVGQLQKWVNSKIKKKINVIAWLNNHINPTIGFKEWINTLIEVKDQHLQCLFDNTLFSTVQNIFEYNLPEDSEDFVYPIKCFIQKQSIFYVADKVADGVTIWRQMTHDDMVDLLKTVYDKMLMCLTKWRQVNQILINENDRISEKFNRAIIKWMTISFAQDATCGRIKNNLYTYLKRDFKSMIEYEIEF